RSTLPSSVHRVGGPTLNSQLAHWTSLGGSALATPAQPGPTGVTMSCRQNIPDESYGEEVDCFCGEWPKLPKIFHKKRCDSERRCPAPSASRGGGRRDDARSLIASINETYQSLVHETPDAMEENALRRAMELSLLDFAIVQRAAAKPRRRSEPSPYEILRIRTSASPVEIKNAYRRCALETHPDKGGEPGEFEAVARAYRTLLESANARGFHASFRKRDVGRALRSTAHWDTELKEHRDLVRELYQNHGMDVERNLRRQMVALRKLGLRRKDAGATNRDERDRPIRNSCFYLSLAASYLSGIGALAVWDKKSRGGCAPGGDAEEEWLREADCALIRDTALQLKRVIEAAVLSAHPEWAAKGMVGEEVQAFSDFLVYILESRQIVSDWAVVVFDTSSGFVDIYKGQGYKNEREGVDETCAASNTLTLRFVPGHYQPLMASSPESSRPTLKDIVSVLDECGVLYVVTDGATPD
ncbi:hypothetical protein ACHAWF_004967, partial [Thalassiosira exigua]